MSHPKKKKGKEVPQSEGLVQKPSESRGVTSACRGDNRHWSLERRVDGAQGMRRPEGRERQHRLLA